MTEQQEVATQPTRRSALRQIGLATASILLGTLNWKATGLVAAIGKQPPEKIGVIDESELIKRLSSDVDAESAQVVNQIDQFVFHHQDKFNVSGLKHESDSGEYLWVPNQQAMLKFLLTYAYLHGGTAELEEVMHQLRNHRCNVEIRRKTIQLADGSFEPAAQGRESNEVVLYLKASLLDESADEWSASDLLAHELVHFEQVLRNMENSTKIKKLFKTEKNWIAAALMLNWVVTLASGKIVVDASKQVTRRNFIRIFGLSAISVPAVMAAKRDLLTFFFDSNEREAYVANLMFTFSPLMSKLVHQLVTTEKIDRVQA